MPTTAEYLALVTSEFRDAVKYNAMLTALIQPLVDAGAVISSLPAKFDLDVAVGQQLDMVGEWVGRSRYIETPLEGVYFSFDLLGLGFDEGTWKGPFDPITGLTVLPDDSYRILLRATIAANRWDGTIPQAYEVWDIVFQGSGFQIVIQDFGDMSMAFGLFGGTPTPILLALLTGGYLALKPSGVRIVDYFVPTIPGAPFFGFDAMTDAIQGFDTGSWAASFNNALLAETEAVVAAMDVQPSQAQILLFNNLIGALLGADIWDQLDAFYVMAVQDANSALINWVAPGTHNLTAYNSPAFLANRGFQGDGIAAYLGLGVNASALTKFLQNSACLGVWSMTNAQGDLNDVTVSFMGGTLPAGVTLTCASNNGTYFDNTFTLQVAPVNTARFTYDAAGVLRGLLNEWARTNVVPNNTAVGLIAGSPGTPPTGMADTVPTGATQTLSGPFTQNGMTYFGVQENAPVAQTTTLFFNMLNSGVAAAANGETWAGTFYTKLLAGSNANILGPNWRISARNAANAEIQNFSTIYQPTTAALGTQRISISGLLTNALTASIISYLRVGTDTVNPTNYTYGMGGEQLEKIPAGQSGASSVILTSGAAATRAVTVTTIGASLVPDGIYDITITREDGVESLLGQAIAGGYVVPNSVSPLQSVRFQGLDQYVDAGTLASANVLLSARDAAGDTAARINDAAEIAATNTDARGYYVSNRSASNARQLYKDAVVIDNDAQVSVARPASEMIILRSGSNYSGRRLAVYHAGGSLTAAQIDAFRMALTNYLTAIGAL